MQLSLSFAAIHTTTELVSQVMVDLCQNPEIIGELRQEMAKALGEGGWKKTSLYNMKLLDSVIKESLRLKPAAIGKFPLPLSLLASNITWLSNSPASLDAPDCVRQRRVLGRHLRPPGHQHRRVGTQHVGS